MDYYIQQLIEDFKLAEENPVEDIEFGDFEDDIARFMEAVHLQELVPAKELVGVSYEELPPAERLTVDQMQELLIAILNALSAKGTNVVFPGNGIPVELCYTEVRKLFKIGFHILPGWTVDFCDGNCKDCVFEKYCDLNNS
jgi:hypothetical protein